MKYKSLHWCLLFIGALLLTMSIVGGDSLNSQELNRLIGINKTVISVKDAHNSNDEVFFNIDNVESLNDREITFTATSTTEIDGKSVCVIGTNSEYPNFENMPFYSGCFFDKNAEAGAAKVVVIDEQLAWDVFGSLNVVGNTLEIFNRKFKVIGVVAPDKSIIGALSNSGISNAYIPGSTLLELDEAAQIKSLQIHNNDTNLSGQNYRDAVNVLGKLVKNPEDYYISDFNIKSTLITQKPRILVFIAGLASIIALLRFLMGRGKEVFIYVQKECQADYLNNVLKNNKAILLKRFLIMLLPVLAIAWFWINIRFALYIPPEYLPKQLIDLTFYFDLFKKGINESVLNRGYHAPLTEIRLASALLLSNYLFYIGLLIGFPILWISLRLTKEDKDIPLSRTLFVLCGVFISSLGLGAIIVFISGISLNLCITDLAVIFSFIYIYAIKYSVPCKP